MDLRPGSRLGPYEIDAPIGEGGMGVVYRARDTRLHRAVAVKVAAERFGDRVEREARAIAALNHPHICQIYDVGPEFLVMELIDGRPLRGPLGIDAALALAVQILDALGAAHRSGIVHRDLKPANILVTKAGIKLLDFGIAKADASAPPELTITAPATATHVIVGTPAYMAPEQLQGRPADARSDLFAFGVVFYEMLTGHRAFSGDTHANLIAAVLKDAPAPVSTVLGIADSRAMALDAVIEGCLAKDPDDRWQSARDLTRELQRITRDSGTAAPGAAAGTRRRERLWIAATAVASITAIALGAAYVWKAAPVSPRMTLSLMPPDEQAMFTADPNAGGLALSPDGRVLAFGAEANGTRHLYLRRLDTGETRIVAGSEAGGKPFWSPDGRSLGFFDSALKRVAVGGGEPTSLAPGNARGGTWNSDGTILFSSSVLVGGTGLMRVSQDGGTPAQVTTVDAASQEYAHHWPQFLPDGRHFLYLARSTNREKNAIYVGSLDDAPLQARRVRIMFSEYRAQYVQAPGARAGFLLFIRGTELAAQRFDPSSVKLEGDPVSVANNVTLVATNGFADFSAASDGTLVFGSRPPPMARLMWKTRAGADGGVVAEAGDYTATQRSPDSRAVAIGRITAAKGKEIYLLNFDRATRLQLTFDELADDPVWSPDGHRIAYDVALQGLFARNADGSGSRQELLKTSDAIRPVSWCGNSILHTRRVNGRLELRVLSMPGAIETPYLQADGNIINAAFSPDCRWVVYQSQESGSNELYLQSFPAGRGKWRVSTAGGLSPRWRADGKEILFRNGSSLMAVTVTTAPDRVVVGAPSRVFDYPGGTIASASMAEFDNGQRFLIADPIKRPNLPITVLLRWHDGLFDRSDR